MTTLHKHPSGRLVIRGFTLLEVLVALLVMSIGLLGIGKLMMLSARANDSAYMRTQATALGYTILDAMRANRQAAVVNGYDTAMGVFPGPAACGTSVATSCTSGQQAQNDLSQWGNALAVELPVGQGSVTTVIAPDGTTGANNITATVVVQWFDRVAEQSFANPNLPAGQGNNSITLETVL